MDEQSCRDDRRPRTADELHAWLGDRLGLHVPREALIAGHNAPFEYLRHAFFADHAPGGGDPIDCVVWANRGGGKTFLGAVATVLDLVFKPGIELRILGGSLEQAGRMHAHLRSLFARSWLSGMVQGRVTERRLRLNNGSGVELLAQSQASVRGTRVQKLRCDEVELFDRQVWQAAQLVTRSARCGGVDVRGSIECMSTMHVPHGLMHDLVAQARDGRRTLFKWGVVDVLDECGPEHRCESCFLLGECGGRAKERGGDNAGHVGVDDAIRMKGRVASATWEAEMLCLRPSRTDAVIPEFDPAIHVVDEHPEAGEGWTWIGGMDFGFRAPTVVLWAAVDPAGVLRVFDERVVAGEVLQTHVAAIKESPWPTLAWIGVDPAGRQRNSQTGQSDALVLRRAGLDVRDRRLGVQQGLSLVRARLRPADASPPRLFVHRRCQRLIESLERYHYPTDRPESLEPVKDGFDHAVDALRYLVTNLDRPIRCVHSRYTPG